jgi:hypothetical protein
MLKSKNLTESLFDKIPAFVKEHVFARTKENVKLPDSTNQGYAEVINTNIFDAQLITSKVNNDYNHHRPILDFDFPVSVVKSSSGNSHVYIDKVLTEIQMDRLVDVLVEVGLLQEGVGNSWLRHKMLTLRPPWVKKGVDESWSQQHDPNAERPKTPTSEQLKQPEPMPPTPADVDVKFMYDKDKDMYVCELLGLAIPAKKMSTNLFTVF